MSSETRPERATNGGVVVRLAFSSLCRNAVLSRVVGEAVKSAPNSAVRSLGGDPPQR